MKTVQASKQQATSLYTHLMRKLNAKEEMFRDNWTQEGFIFFRRWWAIDNLIRSAYEDIQMVQTLNSLLLKSLSTSFSSQGSPFADVWTLTGRLYGYAQTYPFLWRPLWDRQRSSDPCCDSVLKLCFSWPASLSPEVAGPTSMSPCAELTER